MKAAVIKWVDWSFGKALRLFQGMLMNNLRHNLIDTVHNLNTKTSAEYAVTNMSNAMVFLDRPRLYDYCIEEIRRQWDELELGQPEVEETILEFGVYKGFSINYFAKNLTQVKLVGFDSFEGLEEDWTGTFLKKNALTVHGVLPRVLKNVEFRKRWFVDTLPAYLSEKREIPARYWLLNIDCDTYTPTKFILNQLIDHIRPGMIIIFDEYFNYINWQEHEFAAFSEFTKEHNIEYKYIAFTNTTAVAVKIV